MIKHLFGIQVFVSMNVIIGDKCDIGEYLDYDNCKCRKKLVDKLVEECTENDEEVKLAKITLAENENKYKYCSCTLYIVSFLIVFTINIGIGTYFVCYKYMNHNKETDPKEKFYFLGNNYEKQFYQTYK